MSRERAETLRSLLKDHLSRTSFDWDDGRSRLVLALRSPVPSLVDFEADIRTATATPKVEYRYEKRPWFQDGRQHDAYRIVAEGLIIEAAFERDGSWIRLDGEVGKSV